MVVNTEIKNKAGCGILTIPVLQSCFTGMLISFLTFRLIWSRWWRNLLGRVGVSSLMLMCKIRTLIFHYIPLQFSHLRHPSYTLNDSCCLGARNAFVLKGILISLPKIIFWILWTVEKKKKKKKEQKIVHNSCKLLQSCKLFLLPLMEVVGTTIQIWNSRFNLETD